MSFSRSPMSPPLNFSRSLRTCWAVGIVAHNLQQSKKRKVSFICDCDVKHSRQSVASLSSFSVEAVGCNILTDTLLYKTLSDDPQMDQGLSNYLDTAILS